MQTLDPISLTVNTAVLIPLAPRSKGVLIANESPFSIMLDLVGNARWLPAWTMDFIPVSSMQSLGQNITATPTSITNTTNPPSAILLVTIVGINDTVQGIYPCALTRQVSSNVTASSAFDLLAPDSQALISLDDTDIPGSVGIFPSQAPVPTGLLDMWLAARQSAGVIQPWVETDVANLRVNFKMKVGFELNAGIGFYIAGMQVVSGTGPGTFAHTLGVTPQIILLVPTQAAEAFYVGSYTFNNFVVGGITAGHAWKALLIA